jgi:CoA:oxalate CoA-transferase
MTRPLEGVRVLDLTQAYSGPFCTMHLADHGAEVIKIERTGAGDQSRTWGPFKNDFSAYFALINRNKKGITLDLSLEKGRMAFLELARQADVVVENFRVGTMEKLGIGYEEIKKLNPRIIYASISGFGLTGTYAQRPCYDIVAQAMSGMMSVTGHPDGPPVKIGPSVADNYSGTYLALGILMALYQRERTGEGRRLDVAMVDTLFSVMENFVVEYTVGGRTPRRLGNVDPGIAPFDSFRAKDGEFIMGCGTNRFWAALCGLMGREDLVNDPLYETNAKRCDNYLPGLKKIIEDWSSALTVDEVEERLVGAGIPFGRILTIPEIAEHEIIKTRNMLWEVYQPGMDSKIRIAGSVIKMHGLPDGPQKAAPQLGEDTREVLRRVAGYSMEKIDEFSREQVI